MGRGVRSFSPRDLRGLGNASVPAGSFGKALGALYLLVISVVASVVGTRPSFVAAVTSFTWNVFFSSVQHVPVDDPKDRFLSGFSDRRSPIGLTRRLRERETLLSPRSGRWRSQQADREAARHRRRLDGGDALPEIKLFSLLAFIRFHLIAGGEKRKTPVRREE